MLQVNDKKTVERTADTRSNQLRREVSNKHCFVHRDTKQTEKRSRKYFMLDVSEQLSNRSKLSNDERNERENCCCTSDELELPANEMFCLCLHLVKRL